MSQMFIGQLRAIERILIKAEEFRLPGKKELLKTDKNLKTIVIDVTETPIERPKKNKSITIVEKRKSIH